MCHDLIEKVWRTEATHVLAALARYCADRDRCEDAAQEALEAALIQWPRDGIPDAPRAWLIRVGSRRIVDGRRRDDARRMREHLTARQDRTEEAIHWDAEPDVDGVLEMLLLCCHPDLSSENRVILSLNAVAGLPANQIADLLYLGESTTSQRISRAKATIRRGGGFQAPARAQERLAAVLHTIYLMFTQGHTLSRGVTLSDPLLRTEAIRLARALRRELPHEMEVAGLLALMLLTESRHPARTDDQGNLVPLSRQDRLTWDRRAIHEGVELIQMALARGPVGPYQVQAAIAAVHAEASTWAGTDWSQIWLLYRLLARLAPSPTVQLNLAVAESMAVGSECALARLNRLAASEREALGHRFYAARGQILRAAACPEQAIRDLSTAAERCRSEPERRYLRQECARTQSASVA